MEPPTRRVESRARHPLAVEPKPAGPDGARLHLLGLTEPELRAWLESNGLEKFRSTQMLQWIYERGAVDFAQMTNLSKALRESLEQAAIVYACSVVRSSVAKDETTKYLLSTADGELVETVAIPAEGRITACLSSQIGCPVGCRFCASGVAGVKRDLTAGEIVEQAMHVRADLRSKSSPGTGATPRLSNIVFMGMGEPLANYDEVLRAIRILNAPWGLNIGARKITLSTVGLPKQIRRLAAEELQINLALSLHAPDERLRRQLIPWGKVALDELLDACAHYFHTTGREITLEYVLLAGVNDHAEHAAQLATIARRLRANVNLLRYNPVPDLPFERPDAESAYAFQSALRAKGVNAHVRRSRGRDVDAACGQLRRQSMPPDPPAPTRG